MASFPQMSRHRHHLIFTIVSAMLTVVGDRVPPIRDLITFVGDPVPLVGEPVPLIRSGFTRIHRLAALRTITT
ncbi:hypothetical protein [Amycolatopsis rifamycinica]|uniref:hypothetical protein n=1 Tax=Amycolatopsis rifamycinica TaxID=287986 RepID=UPI0005C2471D|nr:hypothetical protein [Amycolatopsis rifamycinica]